MDSIIAVLVIGNFLGALIKGITGFGSAIINLCVWIVATCAGINSGTLQQAVLTECIASEVLAVPLLCMTRAHATCDWALVLSLSIFGAVGAPIGAAMLTHLPPRQVEFAVGCLMLGVILLNCLRKKPSDSTAGQAKAAGSVTAAAAAAQSLPDHTAKEADVMCILQSPAAGEQIQSSKDSCSIELPVVLIQEVDSTVHILSIQNPAALSLPAECADALSLHDHSHEQRHSTSRESSNGSAASQAQCVCLVSPEQPWEADTEDVALLASTGAAKQPLSDSQQHITAKMQLPLVEPTASKQHPGPGLRGRVQLWWAAATQPEKLVVLRRMLTMGSVAGTASGIMAGLTGMGGPPVMLMFERLQVSKDTVRGTNAVCNIIQIRIFAYIAMGVFSRADIALYIAVSVAAVAGMFLGCMAAARTNQATFSRMLTGLMVLCCALMFASAAGIAGNSSSAGHSTS